MAVNTLNNIAEVVVKASLQKAGVDPASVKLAEVDFPEMGAALRKGDVDAAFVIEPFVTAERRERADHRLLLRDHGAEACRSAPTR